MQILPITALTTAFFAILMVVLSIQTSLRRAKLKTVHGDGGDVILRRRIRAHGNFAEYAPLALVILGLVEAFGATRSATVALAAAFCVARVLHAVGMLYMSRAACRAAGMFVQHAAMLFGAYFLVKHVLSVA